MKTFLSTLAITLAITFTAAPAEAGLTEGQKCAMKANLLSGKFSLCLNKADANVSKGRLSDTAAADAKCETKFRSGWDKTRTKAQEKDADNGNAEMLGADCNGAMSDAVRDSVEALALIAAGREMTAFAVSETDIAGDSGIQELIDEAVAEVDITSDNASLCTDAGGTYDAGTDTCSVDITSDNASLCTDAGGTYDAGTDTCSVDITSDNAEVAAAAEQTGCEAAGGTWRTVEYFQSLTEFECWGAGGYWGIEGLEPWEEGPESEYSCLGGTSGCTAVLTSSFKCAIGAMCSYWAAAYPHLSWSGNNYSGDTAASTGCPQGPWDLMQNQLSNVDEFFDTPGLYLGQAGWECGMHDSCNFLDAFDCANQLQIQLCGL
ncbi:hypothetical protein OAE84_00810 [bacterium]|nr:hypothetical protein [bacterium]